MKKLFFFYSLLFLTFLASCGQDSPTLDPQISRVGETLSITQRNLSEEEKRVALKICDAFRAKWTEFRISKLDTPFNFKYTRTSCDGEIKRINPLVTNLRRVLDSQPLIYDTAIMEDTMLFMESHLHGYLAQTCQALQSGRNHTIAENKDGKTLLFSYNPRGVLNEFTVFITIPAQNGFKVEEQATYSVLTSPPAGKEEFRGMVTNSLRQKSCPAGSVRESSEFEQSFTLP